MEVDLKEAIDEDRALKKIKECGSSFDKLLSLIKSSDSLIAGLTYFLKNAKSDGGKGLGLIGEYLASFPDCEHILAPLEWEKDKRTYDVHLVTFRSLEVLLLYTSSPFTISASSKRLHLIGEKLVRTILTNHMKCIYHSLRSVVPVRLVAACLRLLVVMVMQGSDSAKELQSVFNFGYKPLAIFANRNTPIKDETESVRELLMKFALAFLELGDPWVITTILEVKGFLSSFFTLLPKDSPKIIHHFLTLIFEKVVMNPLVSKKSKSLFFSQFMLKQIALLLIRPLAESDKVSSGNDLEQETCLEVPTLSYNLLSRLCSDSRLGILYVPKSLPSGLEKTNNPVLLHFLLFLSGRLREFIHQRLILDIMKNSSDLLLPYVKSITFTFEPQPTSRWVRETSLLSQLYGCYQSVDKLLCGEDRTCQPDIKWVGVAIGVTAPPIVTRSHYNQGLQHPLPVVKHVTLQLISVVLQRTDSVLHCWGPVRKNSKTISSFLVNYADAVLKCLPDIQTLVSLWQTLQSQRNSCSKNSSRSNKDGKLLPEDKVKNADLADGSTLLAQISMVMCGYQKLCPDIFLQINFNPAKLLTPLPRSHNHVKELPDPEVLYPILKLIENISNESRKKSIEMVANLLWLLHCEAESLPESRHFIKKILFKEHFQTDTSLENFLSSFCESCSSFPEAAVELVREVAEIVSETLVDKYRLEVEVEEALGLSEVVRRKGEEGDLKGRGGVRRGLSLHDVLKLPDNDLFDILDEVTGKPGRGAECGGVAAEGGAGSVNLKVWDSARYTLIASVAAAYQKERKPVLSYFLFSLLAHYFRAWVYPGNPHSMLCLSLHHAPSLAIFLVRHLIIPSDDFKLVSDSDDESILECVSTGRGVAVELAEIQDEGVFQACRMLDQKTSSELEALDLMKCLEPNDWNEFLHTCLKSRFCCSHTLHLLALVSPVLYKAPNSDYTPLTLVYDMVWSHSEFIEVISSGCYRESLVELLVTLVQLEPSVAKDKTSHQLVFLGAYTATLSSSDRGLLYLMSLYEKNEAPAGKYSPFLWGAAALERHQGLEEGDLYWRSPAAPSEVLKLLDAQMMLKSASSFSPTHSLQPASPFVRPREMTSEDLGNVYDPCFLLPLLSHLLEPGLSVDCRQFVARGCLGFLMVCLSSLHRNVRAAAGHALTRFRVHLDDSKFREKAQISLLMDVLQNSIRELNAFLPSVFTSLAAKTSRLFLHADSPVYSVVARFIVHKPALHLWEIPLLGTMLHSSGPKSAVERKWLMKVLLDGLKCEKDHFLYDKHKVFSHISALAESSMLDRHTKSLAGELLAKDAHFQRKKKSDNLQITM